MKNKNLLYIPVLLLTAIILTILTGCQGTTPSPSNTNTNSPVSNKELTVFAGSASKPPLDEIGQLFEQQTGIKVYLTYGGSGAVLSQMKLSKTGDVYIPGSPDYLSKAEKDNVLVSGSSQIIAYLVPTINVQHGNPQNIQSLSDLAKPGLKIGIGNPETVCVGLYAIEVLEYNQLLASVNKNIITQADSCDKTATLVALKSVDAVLGWDVFHSWNPGNIDTIYLQENQIPRLAYIPAAISSFTKDQANAQKFIEFLTSSTGKDIFRKWGYNVTEAEARKFAPEAKIGGEYQLPEAYANINQ